MGTVSASMATALALLLLMSTMMIMVIAMATATATTTAAAMEAKPERAKILQYSAGSPPARQSGVSTQSIFYMAVAKKHHFFHY
jgi:NADH:ubiquinone oxidoreductase subunit 3 (subunit A)